MVDPQPDAPPSTGDDAGLLRALEPAHRFRCEACGNVTRFDVTVTATTRRFHHFDLGGDSWVEEEEVLEQTVGSVVCRWCGRSDAIKVESAPLAGA
jgi:transposase